MTERFFYLTAVPAIIISINLFVLCAYILINKPFRKNLIGFRFLLGCLLFFTINSLNYDTDWTGTNDPHITEQAIMFARLTLCSFTAFAASLCVNKGIQEKMFYADDIFLITLVVVFVAVCMFISTKFENNIQPVQCCGDYGPTSAWGYPYRWSWSMDDEFRVFENGTRFYLIAFVADVIFWSNPAIILAFIAKKLFASNTRTNVFN